MRAFIGLSIEHPPIPAISKGRTDDDYYCWQQRRLQCSSTTTTITTADIHSPPRPSAAAASHRDVDDVTLLPLMNAVINNLKIDASLMVCVPSDIPPSVRKPTAVAERSGHHFIRESGT